MSATTSRAGRFSDYQVDIWLATMLSQTHYLGLFSQDPFGVSNPSTVEVTGASYARQVPVFVKTGRTLIATQALVWAGLAAGSQVAYIGGFDAAFNGNMRFAAPVPGSVLSYPTGGTLTIPANNYIVGFDS